MKETNVTVNSLLESMPNEIICNIVAQSKNIEELSNFFLIDTRFNKAATYYLCGLMRLHHTSLSQSFDDKKDEDKVELTDYEMKFFDEIKKFHSSMESIDKALFLDILRKDMAAFGSYLNLTEIDYQTLADKLIKMYSLLKYFHPEYKKALFEKIKEGSNKSNVYKSGDLYFLFFIAICLGQFEFVEFILEHVEDFREEIFKKTLQEEVRANSIGKIKIIFEYISLEKASFKIAWDDMRGVFHESLKCGSSEVLKYLLQTYLNEIKIYLNRVSIFTFIFQNTDNVKVQALLDVLESLAIDDSFKKWLWEEKLKYLYTVYNSPPFACQKAQLGQLGLKNKKGMLKKRVQKGLLEIIIKKDNMYLMEKLYWKRKIVIDSPYKPVLRGNTINKLIAELKNGLTKTNAKREEFRNVEKTVSEINSEKNGLSKEKYQKLVNCLRNISSLLSHSSPEFKETLFNEIKEGMENLQIEEVEKMSLLCSAAFYLQQEKFFESVMNVAKNIDGNFSILLESIVKTNDVNILESVLKKAEIKNLLLSDSHVYGMFSNSLIHVCPQILEHLLGKYSREIRLQSIMGLNWNSILEGMFTNHSEAQIETLLHVLRGECNWEEHKNKYLYSLYAQCYPVTNMPHREDNKDKNNISAEEIERRSRLLKLRVNDELTENAKKMLLKLAMQNKNIHLITNFCRAEKVNINSLYYVGYGSALHFAIANKCGPEIVKCLLEQGARVGVDKEHVPDNFANFLYGQQQIQENSSKALQSSGSYFEPLSRKNNKEKTPLHLMGQEIIRAPSFSADNLSIFNQLLNAKDITVDICNNVLHMFLNSRFILGSERQPYVDILMEKVDLVKPDKNKQTTIDVAIKGEKWKWIEFWLNRGNIELVCNGNLTAAAITISNCAWIRADKNKLELLQMEIKRQQFVNRNPAPVQSGSSIFSKNQSIKVPVTLPEKQNQAETLLDSAIDWLKYYTTVTGGIYKKGHFFWLTKQPQARKLLEALGQLKKTPSEIKPENIISALKSYESYRTNEKSRFARELNYILTSCSKLQKYGSEKEEVNSMSDKRVGTAV